MIPSENLISVFANSNLSNIENKVPTTPANAANKKYKVPISL